MLNITIIFSSQNVLKRCTNYDSSKKNSTSSCKYCITAMKLHFVYKTMPSTLLVQKSVNFFITSDRENELHVLFNWHVSQMRIFGNVMPKSSWGNFPPERKDLADISAAVSRSHLKQLGLLLTQRILAQVALFNFEFNGLYALHLSSLF